ncbi:MAG: DUF3027 domain-containing protein [Lacisediminihabitans sp.]
MSWMPESGSSEATITTEATAADFELGRAALLEITTEETVGENAGSVNEGEGVVSVHFETTLEGYPGWHWTVSIAHVEGGEPSVLETELLPGDGALVAPDWVPWVDRLADYRAAQDAAGVDGGEAEDEPDIDVDDDDDDDELDNHLLHGGDLDGVDIDDIDDDDSDDDDDDSDDDDDDSDDDSDDDDYDDDDSDDDDSDDDDSDDDDSDDSDDGEDESRD